MPLTADYGAPRTPMLWNWRVYFLSDRDGVMNVWSMDARGRTEAGDPSAIPRCGFASLSRAVSCTPAAPISGGSIWTAGSEQIIPITLFSDFDQLRDHWVKRPVNY